MRIIGTAISEEMLILQRKYLLDYETKLAVTNSSILANRFFHIVFLFLHKKQFLATISGAYSGMCYCFDADSIHGP